MELEKLARKHALKNALKHNGRAVLQAVITAAISENKDVKKNIKEFVEIARRVIEEVNSKSKEEQEKLLEELFPGELESLNKPKEERPLREVMKDLFGLGEGEKVISAFPPEPSKYPYLGHVKGIVLNYELAKNFNGEFILRFEDTNHEKVKKEYYDAILETCEWLGIKPDKIVYASKELEILYKYAEELIKKGLAYVCSCSVEEVRNSRATGKACKHRDQSIEENMAKWREMFNAPSGSSILRAKIDLKHKNTTMRDPTLFRIVDADHPLVGNKYRVWPTYDFETAILDGVYGVNYRLRSKEFEIRSELQNYFQEVLGLTVTRYEHYARFNIEGVPSSGRIIREKINNGELLGWDDPALTTIAALRRRGFQPEAIREFVKHTGFSKNEGLFTWNDLEAYNRRHLDPITKRYFFIAEPVRIVVEDAPQLVVNVRRHPDNDLGSREFKTGKEFWVTKKDYESFKLGNLYRFMELFNFVVEEENGKKRFRYHSREYKEYKGKGKAIIHWLPVGYEVGVEVLMPDKTIVEGYGENYLEELNIGEVIQAERFGFMRLDEKNEKLRFWYTHK